MAEFVFYNIRLYWFARQHIEGAGKIFKQSFKISVFFKTPQGSEYLGRRYYPEFTKLRPLPYEIMVFRYLYLFTKTPDFIEYFLFHQNPHCSVGKEALGNGYRPVVKDVKPFLYNFFSTFWQYGIRSDIKISFLKLQ